MGWLSVYCQKINGILLRFNLRNRGSITKMFKVEFSPCDMPRASAIWMAMLNGCLKRHRHRLRMERNCGMRGIPFFRILISVAQLNLRSRVLGEMSPDSKPSREVSQIYRSIVIPGIQRILISSSYRTLRERVNPL